MVKLSVNYTVYFKVRLTSSCWYVQLSTVSNVIFFMPTKEMFRFKVCRQVSGPVGVLKSTALGFRVLLVRELKRKVPFQNLYGAGHPTESL